MHRRALLCGIAAAIAAPVAACASREKSGNVATGEATGATAVEPIAPSVVLRAGAEGSWTITRLMRVIGEPLPAAPRLDIIPGLLDERKASAAWTLRGAIGNEGITEQDDRDRLNAISPPLGRPEATRAALIPIRKSAAWWSLSLDARRTIFETKSHHLTASRPLVTRVARRLYRGRELGEPFDFLTWFEFAPEDERAFDELVMFLRATDEWRYVEREVDIRLTRAR
jgi:hypothetical protein